MAIKNNSMNISKSYCQELWKIWYFYPTCKLTSNPARVLRMMAENMTLLGHNNGSIQIISISCIFSLFLNSFVVTQEARLGNPDILYWTIHKSSLCFRERHYLIFQGWLHLEKIVQKKGSAFAHKICTETNGELSANTYYLQLIWLL